MRQAARSIILTLLVLLGAVAVGVSYTVTAAVSLAAKAIVVPGTGDPDANVIQNYLNNFRDYYMGGTVCAEPDACDVPLPNPDATLIGINYPASFWPLVIFPGWCEPGTCERWNDSVADGVAGLNAAVIDALADPDEHIVIAGYSQGGQVVSNQLRNLTALSDAQKAQLEVVLIGNIANPDGGLWPRLSPFNIFAELLLDATLGPPMITDSGIPITSIGFEYDPVVYSPLYWGNPFAVLNALVGFDTVHGQYLAGPNRPDAGELPYGYTPEEVTELVDAGIANCGEPGSNCRRDGHGNKYIMIPAKSLPLADAVLSLGASVGLTPIVKPLVDLFAPVVKVLVDLGYDWSGDPGIARPLSPLPFNPFNNWLQVGLDLIEATGQGVEAFLSNFGVTTNAPTNAPATTPATTAETTSETTLHATDRAPESEPAAELRAVQTPAAEPAAEPVERLAVSGQRTTAPKLRPVTERATLAPVATDPADQVGAEPAEEDDAKLPTEGLVGEGLVGVEDDQDTGTVTTDDGDSTPATGTDTKTSKDDGPKKPAKGVKRAA
ncbi:PE-PPE domain-containing protein [Mycolicibacterium thermoresistibile]